MHGSLRDRWSRCARRRGRGRGAARVGEAAHDLLDVPDVRAILERRGHAALLVRDGLEVDRLALDRGERVARSELELIAAEVREYAEAIALEADEHLEGVVARGYGSVDEDRNLRLL